MSIDEKAIFLHKQWNGKIETCAKAPVKSREDLSIAYTPGVAAPCRIIAEDKDAAYTYTLKANTVAVVSDGSAVLGLGNIGPEAAMPVMEGKCVLFKEFGGVNAFPICLSTQDTDEIIAAVKAIAPTFGGINLEDISAPRCFEIERRLKACCDIPIFHDDQHGTAIVTLAALLNALKLIGKQLEDITVVTSGAGAAGIAIIKLLHSLGLRDAILCDKLGAIYKGREKLNPQKEEMALISNHNFKKGTLSKVIEGADVFIGVSAPGILTAEMIQKMAKDPIIFALANPQPEIMPEQAYAAGAAIVGTGRSDYPNQINNVLAFPGIFRGALDVRASDINDKMQIAAAYAIANTLTASELNRNCIIPNVFDTRVTKNVANAVSQAAIQCGLNRI